MNVKLTKCIQDANCITHAGTFHADEIFATIILSEIMDQIVLIRLPEVKESDYPEKMIYDIGGGKYDHHQVGGNGQRENGVKYASCGLIWKNFGLEVLKKRGVRDAERELVFNIVDRDIIQFIDSNDNGQAPVIDTDYGFMHLSKIIAQFNPCWDEECDRDDNFYEALQLAKTVWDNFLKNIIHKVAAKEFVDKAIEDSEDGIMILNRFMPWKEFVIDSTNPKAKDINFIIFPSNRGGYCVYTIPVEKDSFESRKLFPVEWGGLRDEALQKATGVDTAKFCHNARFLCTTLTLKDALKIASIAQKN